MQTLREAKLLTESREQEEEAFVESRKSNFGAQFDDFQGTCYFFFTFYWNVTVIFMV